MFEKELLFGEDARVPVLAGAEKVAKAVRSTLGPLGRNVLIRRGQMRPPLITKDGVTVANEIKSFPNFYEDMGLQMVKEAARKTNDIAGDGTTTATILTHELMAEGMKHIKDGSNAIHLRRGMQHACEHICQKLEEMKITVDTPDQYKAIATISSQDEEIGALVALVVQEVGQDGAITVESGQALGIDYVLTEGMQLSSGYVSQYFVNKKEKMMAVMDNPYVLVTDERITTLDQILPAIEIVNKEGGKLCIIAESIEHEALTALSINLPWVKVKGQDPSQKADFESLAIRAPEIGDRRNDVLQDIAIKVGARLITKGVGLSLKSLVLQDLGRAGRIISNQIVTTIVDGEANESALEERVAAIKDLMEQAETTDDKDFLKGRLANITGHIAVIRVGASSEVEQKEKQHRVEDAIAAVRAASEEGIVPGGGTAYLRCIANTIHGTKDEITGWNIVMDTLKKPLWWIASNAGYNADDVVEQVLRKEMTEGFNAETGEYVDMIASNIIDPKKVSRCALQNAVSVASTFLTCEVAVSDDPMYVSNN